MSDEVVPFPGVTRLDVDPDRVLQTAVGVLDQVVICGLDHAGNFFFASSQADGGEVLWHLERARWFLMKTTDELEEG